MHERVAAPDDVEGLGEFLFEDVTQDELHRFFHSELAGALVGDGDHLFGEVDADHLGAIRLREVKGGPADAAADVEDANPRAERRAQTGAEVIGRPGTAGADVAGAEDHLVSQDAGAAVLAMVIELGSGGRGRLRRRHVISQLGIRPARSRMIVPRE